MSHISLLDLQQEVHQTAVEKGWWETDRNMGEMLALVHSEISEAHEAADAGDNFRTTFVNGKPEGFLIECADVVIRLLALGPVGGFEATAETPESVQHDLEQVELQLAAKYNVNRQLLRREIANWVRIGRISDADKLVAQYLFLYDAMLYWIGHPPGVPDASASHNEPQSAARSIFEFCLAEERLHGMNVNIERQLNLTHRAVSAALEEWRMKKETGEAFFEHLNHALNLLNVLCGTRRLLEAVRLKADYNKTRPYRHGGKAA